MEDKALYVRLPVAKHRALSALAGGWGISLSALVESMVDQVLFQCVPMYDAPPWLIDAVDSGVLPIHPCPEDESIIAGIDNVVRLADAR
jgi:hypothetical protein